MIVFDSLDKIKDMPETATALGNFDGVHVGHRAIITAAAQKAKARGLKSCVFTFSNHPKNLIPGAKPVKNGRRLSGGHSVYRRNHDDGAGALREGASGGCHAREGAVLRL